MTEKIGAAARAAAGPGTEVRAVSPTMGPVSIEGYYDEAFALPGMLDEVRRGEARGDVDAYVIACFDDPGVDAARTIARGPVIGIAEAAMHVATLLAGSFTIVTTTGRAVPALEHLARKYGFVERCRRVRACEFPVLALEDPASGAVATLRTEIARALAEDRCEAVVPRLRRDGRPHPGARPGVRPACHRRRGRCGEARRSPGRPRSHHEQGRRLRPASV
jgi:allantoin racemase